jgi:hypothetical protein
MAVKNKRGVDEFWSNYEVQCGEKVLSFTLGQYLSGWTEWETSLWGLLIATDGGFRFHHFPHEGWIQALSRITSGAAAPTEKTLFIPRDRIVSAELWVEKSLLKRFFVASSPRLVVRYLDTEGGEAVFVAETDKKAAEVAESLLRTRGPESQAHDP